MKYLLDTDICIYLINSRSAELQATMRSRESEGLAVSAITQCELWYGVTKSGSRRNRDALAKFLSALTVLDFTHELGEVYAAVRARLEAKGTPIGPLDTLIAAHALGLGLTLVTNNVREFKRVKGLRVENWAESRAGI